MTEEQKAQPLEESKHCPFRSTLMRPPGQDDLGVLVTRLNIRLATGHDDRVLPLRSGEIEADGIELNHLLMAVENTLVLFGKS